MAGADGITTAVGRPPTRARLRPVRHDLSRGCGIRLPCPTHGTLEGGYLPAEALGNGDLVAHCCGRTWRPTELGATA